MRVFICTDTKYPRGNAGANYVQYMALALKEKVSDICVIGAGKYSERDYETVEDIYRYRGIRYICLQKKKLHGIPLYNRLGHQMIDELENMMISDNDIIITYSHDYFLMSVLRRYAARRSIRIFGTITEWEQPFQYKYGVVDPRYILYWLNFECVLPKFSGVIGISRVLTEHFSSKKVPTFGLPIMIDPYEFEYKPVRDNEVTNFIYSGRAEKKDDWSGMIRALASLNDEEKKRLRFHLTGMKETDLVRVLEKDAQYLKSLEQVIVLHPWMEYAELIDLYFHMDYLLLMRKANKVTLANFPSKIPEMMCYGIVPVCSAVGDYVSYLNDRNDAYIIQGSSVDEAIRVIRMAINTTAEEKSRMRDNARKTAISRFNYREWSDKLYEFVR